MREKHTAGSDYEIDLLQLARALWQHVLIIAAACVVLAAVGYGYGKLMITPKYEASALMYVNNSSISLGGASVTFSTSQLSAARSLVDTYSVIMKTRMTLNSVIRQTGVNYSYEALSKMVRAESKDETEIFTITVTSTDPEEAALLANCIADTLPDKISDVMEGSSVKIVDRAVVPVRPVSPGARRYAMIGFLLGLVISCGVVILVELNDTVIRDEEYLMQNYDLPLLGVVPDLQQKTEQSSSRAGKTAKGGAKK